MSTKSNLIRLIAAGLLASFAAASAQAEVSQKEQQRQAQAAFEASSKSYGEAAAGWQQMKDTAEAVRDTARQTFEVLGVFK